jgi:cytochrome P450
MNPAFGAAQIREMTGIFVDKSIELRDAWEAELQKHQNEGQVLDVLSWLSRMTLDVIGQAGKLN